MFWLRRQKNLIAMDTKMKGLGYISKAEKDAEQIVSFAGVEFLDFYNNCSVYSLIFPSMQQIILKAISKVVLSWDKTQL